MAFTQEYWLLFEIKHKIERYGEYPCYSAARGAIGPT